MFKRYLLPLDDVKKIGKDLVLVGCVILVAEYAAKYAIVHGVKYAACKLFAVCATA